MAQHLEYLIISSGYVDLSGLLVVKKVHMTVIQIQYKLSMYIHTFSKINMFVHLVKRESFYLRTFRSVPKFYFLFAFDLGLTN